MHGNDITTEDAQVGIIPMMIHGHDENLQMEHAHQKVDEG